MAITQEFIKKLQETTNQKFWENPPEKATFQDVLDQYAIYYHSLKSAQSREELSAIFWDQVKAAGTPIIEERSDGKCEVYFFFPKNAISDSKVKGYDVFLMSVPSFNKLDTNKLGEKPYLIKDEKGGYKIWGYKEGIWQVTDISELEIPIQWEPNQTIFVSDTDPIFDTLKKGHTQVKKDTKKDLYLQGDFHGYGSTDGRKRLLELSDTGIMWHKDRMSKDALVAYSFIQVEPNHRGKKPVPERSPFFNKDEGFIPHSTKTNFPEIPQEALIDENSTHSSLYPGTDSPEKIFQKIFRANPENSHIQSKPIDWPSLLSTQTPSNERHFVYHTTLYSDQAGDLHHSEAKVTKEYLDDLHNGYQLSLLAVPSFNTVDTNKLSEKPYLIKDEEKSQYKIWGYKEGTWQLTDVELSDKDISKIPPKWEKNQTMWVSSEDAIFDTLRKGHTHDLYYANFTRNIQLFKPASGKIDDIVVINDGIPYLITGILDHFEKMVNEKTLSPNTAFVFIGTLPGLKTTLSSKAAEAFDKDPSANLPGMGERLIDYKHGIDQYIDFIANKLFPQLKDEKISVPDDPKHRVMIGSSLSGTASIYICLKRPDLFGAVIVQSLSVRL